MMLSSGDNVVPGFLLAGGLYTLIERGLGLFPAGSFGAPLAG